MGSWEMEGWLLFGNSLSKIQQLYYTGGNRRMWTILEQLISLILCLLPFLALLLFRDHLALEDIRIIDPHSLYKLLFRGWAGQRRQERRKAERLRAEQAKDIEQEDDEDFQGFELEDFYVDCEGTLQSQYCFEEYDAGSAGYHQRKVSDRRKIMRRKRHQNRYRARRPMEDKITIIKVLYD